MSTTETKATNITWHTHNVTREERAKQKNQKPCILWFTGLSGSGKSTIANALEGKLFDMGYQSYLLDGDNVRHGLNKDLGFTDADRVENIRRIGEVSKLFVDAGLFVMTAFISPFRSDRDMVRKLVGEGEFIEIFVDTPLEVCEERDPKGLYKKARAGQIKNFTGLDSPYEAPLKPELVIKTAEKSVEEIANDIVAYLKQSGLLA
jgi:adenylylsulfate kinase